MHLYLTTEVYLQQALLALPACRQEHDAIMKLRLQELLRRGCSQLVCQVCGFHLHKPQYIQNGTLEPVTLLLHFWPSSKPREASAPGLHISLPFHMHHSIAPLLMLGHCVLS